MIEADGLAGAEYSAVFISPHLDDAVFSCAGKMAELSRGSRILVINIFTSFEGAVHDRSVVFGNERLLEEEEASQKLNYDYINMGEKDAYFRGFRRGSIGKVFYPPRSEDFVYLSQLREKVLEKLSAISFAELYVPLAMGWHIDHYLVHLIFNDVAGPYCKKVRFYEDVPYVFFPGARLERLEFLQSGQGSQQVRRLFRISGKLAQLQRIFTNLVSLSVAFFNSGFTQNIRKVPWRYLIMPYMMIYFLRLILMQRKAVQLEQRFRFFQSEDFKSGSYFDLKMTAILCYKTQVKELFGNEAAARRSYAFYSQQVLNSEDDCERYWRPVVK